MRTALRTADQAYRLGVGVGRSAADMLRMEIVAAIYLNRMEMLDKSCRPYGPFHGSALGEAVLRAEAGEFADEFERAWWDGLRGRCGEIIERLNTNSVARLPESAG